MKELAEPEKVVSTLASSPTNSLTIKPKIFTLMSDAEDPASSRSQLKSQNPTNSHLENR